MITPRFSCSQDVRSLTLSVYCPSVRASELEIHVDDTLLSLHVAPYFLRLNFPASVVEDDQSSAIYDPASGYLTLTLTKLNPGENFQDLDLLGKLLAPPACQSTPHRPTIEVLASQEANTERSEILQGMCNYVYSISWTELASNSRSERLDGPSDYTRYASSVGNISSQTVRVSQRIHWVLYPRSHH